MNITADQSRPRLRTPQQPRKPMFHRIFRADPMTVRDALVFLRERFDGSAADEVIGRLELALGEVLNNICEHGTRDEARRLDGRVHSPLIHLCVVRHVGGIACAVTDDGKPLPPECLDPRSLPYIGHGEDDLLMLPEGGFGWYLIQDLTASLSYFREGRRNFLAFIVPVGDHPPGEINWNEAPTAKRPSRASVQAELQRVTSVLELAEHLIDFGVFQRLAGTVGHKVLLRDIGDIVRRLGFGIQVIERLIARRARVLGN